MLSQMVRLEHLSWVGGKDGKGMHQMWQEGIQGGEGRPMTALFFVTDLLLHSLPIKVPLNEKLGSPAKVQV